MKTKVILVHGERASDGWTVGKAICDGVECVFNVKHFDKPSEYGIDCGKISKLWLSSSNYFDDTILNYDRGWEEPFTPDGKDENVKAIYNALIEKFN